MPDCGQPSQHPPHPRGWTRVARQLETETPDEKPRRDGAKERRMSESKGPAATANTSLQVVVDRSKWLRGGGAGAKLLQPRTGHKCIIGHIAAQAGLMKEIAGVNYLGAVLAEIKKKRTKVSLHPALAEFSPGGPQRGKPRDADPGGRSRGQDSAPRGRAANEGRRRTIRIQRLGGDRGHRPGTDTGTPLPQAGHRTLVRRRSLAPVRGRNEPAAAQHDPGQSPKSWRTNPPAAGRRRLDTQAERGRRAKIADRSGENDRIRHSEGDHDAGAAPALAARQRQSVRGGPHTDLRRQRQRAARRVQRTGIRGCRRRAATRVLSETGINPTKRRERARKPGCGSIIDPTEIGNSADRLPENRK